MGNKGVVYVKANLLHEFGGGYDVTMTDSTGRVKVSDSFDDTWFEYGLGAAVTMGSNSQLYVDVERSSGSDFKKDWACGSIYQLFCKSFLRPYSALSDTPVLLKSPVILLRLVS